MKCPYCQNSSFVYKSGFSRPVKCCSEGRRQRYRCGKCRRRFSENCHSFSFRQKHADRALNSKILNLFLHGLSNRQIALSLGVSEHCIRLRLERLSRQALLFHQKQTRGIKIEEAIAYDGLENFSGSQYDVNNIQQALGADSLFVYDFNFVPLNRKGRMSDWQKSKLRNLEMREGRYDPSAIRKASEEIFLRLYEKRGSNRLDLLSDEHFQYRRALKSKRLSKCSIDHKTVSSKETRNYQNILFPVNHLDLLIRHRIGAFRRETISFAKTPHRMIQKYILFVVEKNYMKPQFTKLQKRRQEASQLTPAQLIGVCKKRMGFKEIYCEYPREDKIKELNNEWRYYWKNDVPGAYKRHLKYRRKSA